MSFTPPTAQHDDEIDDSVLPSGEIKPNVNWEKVLWRHQPYPDNYVPPSFLSELKDLCLPLHLSRSIRLICCSPVSRPRPRLVSLIWAVLPVSQHLAVIALFLAVFYRLLVYDLGPGQVGWGCVVFGFVGFGIHRWGWGHSYPRRSDPTSSWSLLTVCYALAKRSHSVTTGSNTTSTLDTTSTVALPTLAGTRHTYIRNNLRLDLASSGRTVLPPSFVGGFSDWDRCSTTA